MSEIFGSQPGFAVGSGPAGNIPDPVLPANKPSEDTATSTSAEAAETLVQKFYPALSATRDTIASFYVPPTVKDGQNYPKISFNGNAFHNGQDFENMIKQIEPLTFDVESLDCAPLNTVYTSNGDPGDAARKGKHMTILVTVGGSVKVGDLQDDDERGFSDSYVLVPNPEIQHQKRRGKLAKDWLIQSHNFRFVS